MVAYWLSTKYLFLCFTGRGRGRGRRGRTPYMSAMVDANRRANVRSRGSSPQSTAAAGATEPRKQSYSLFLKQRAVLFSAKKWKQ